MKYDVPEPENCKNLSFGRVREVSDIYLNAYDSLGHVRWSPCQSETSEYPVGLHRPSVDLFDLARRLEHILTVVLTCWAQKISAVKCQPRNRKRYRSDPCKSHEMNAGADCAATGLHHLQCHVFFFACCLTMATYLQIIQSKSSV